jgi:threonine synthase
MLICKECGNRYETNEPRWRCDCGGLLDLDFQPRFDIAKIQSRKPFMWRYREAIPIERDTHIVSFSEGFTPMIELQFGGIPVLFKQDHLFPTGSFKDRGASVLVSKIKELGITEVVEDSSGNAGSAVAGYCARAGIACDIYVPQSTSEGKCSQVTGYGARLTRVPGSREDTARAAYEAAASTYYASHTWNPWFFHGTKTFAYEVCEQLGWKSPGTLVTPVGNGTLLLGAFIGFNELLNAGIIDRLPRIIAVQTEACAPLAYAGGGLPVTTTPTMAEGIAVAEPVRGREIITAVERSGGFFMTVLEEEIRCGLADALSRGFYIEPTSAVVCAAISKLGIDRELEQPVVSLFTGHGLKAAEKIVKLLAGG